jgi:hypothetical protein
LINIYFKALEALYEGYAQKGFKVLGLTLDGSPVPLGLKAAHEPIEIPKSLWERWKSLDATGSKPCGSRGKAIQNKLISVIINDHRGTSGLKASMLYSMRSGLWWVNVLT